MTPVEVPRVYLHDGAGRRIGLVSTARNVDRAYLIMEPASARFTVATNDPLKAEFDPLLGRIVVIESEQYPYPWVGKLTVPSWSHASEEITVVCRSLDAILAQRTISGTFTGGAGAVFTAMIQAAAAVNPTGIGVALNGVTPGPRYSATINRASAYSALNALAYQTGHEWWIEPAVTESEVIAYAHFRPARGFDRCRDFELVEGGNAEWLDCKINGEATTFAMTMVGGAESTLQAFDERPYARRQASSALGVGSTAPVGSYHGHSVQRTDPGGSPMTRIERVEMAESLKAQGLVQDAADAFLGRPWEPELAMTWQAAADRSAVTRWDWSRLDVGSIVRAVAPTAFTSGFDGSVRILATQPYEEGGYLGLVVAIVGDHS